jgi:hypothetical protein
MARDVTIRINATDAASPVFQRIGSSAQTMGTQVSASADKADRSLDNVSRRGAAMGAALGTAIGSTVMLLGEFGRAAAEEEAVFARLEQAVVATGESYDQYSSAIDRAINRGKDLAFSDDQIADALSRMTTTTGSAQAALDNLGLAMDFARARGIDLSTASDLIAKAYTGNFQTLARYGIQLDENATKTEALAAIQAQSAGQAEAYGNTQAASIDRAKNSLDDFTESIGAHAGSITTLVALLPGLTAGWTLMSGALGGLTGALTGAGGATAAVGGFGAAMGTAAAAAAIFAPAIALVGYTAYTAKDNLKAVTKETELLNEALSELGEPEGGQIDRVFGAFSQNMVLIEATVGDTVETLETSFDELMGLQGDFLETFANSAEVAAINWDIPLNQQQEAVENLIVLVHTLDAEQEAFYARSRGALTLQTRGPATPGIVSTAPYYGTQPTGYTGPYQPAQPTAVPGGSEFDRTQPMAIDARAAPMVNAGDLATFDTALGSLEAYREALRAGRVEMELLNGAQMNMADAQLTFKVTQDTLIEGQQEFNQQQSEYQTQLSALEAGYTVLQERQAEGVKLTEEEQALLDNYPELYGRLEGGVEDATVAQALFAAQYAENMKIGDEMNQNLESNSGSMESLTDSVNALIETLGGVPPTTDVEITDNQTALATQGEIEGVQSVLDLLDGDSATASVGVNGALESQGQLSGVLGLLNSIDGRHATSTVTTVVNTVQGGGGTSGGVVGTGPGGGGMHGLTAYANGGTVFDPLMPRFANGGTFALVGEVGPELVKLSRGDQVMPAGGSRAVMDRGRGRGGGINVQNLYLYPASPDVDGQIRAAVLGEWR